MNTENAYASESRPAGEDDISDIVRMQVLLVCHHGLTPSESLWDGVREAVSAGEYWIHVVWDPDHPGGSTVGCARLALLRSDWNGGYWGMVDSVYVEPEFRRRGIASSLLRAMEASKKATAGLYMFVQHGNAAALATWRKLGFAESPNYITLEKECAP